MSQRWGVTSELLELDFSCSEITSLRLIKFGHPRARRLTHLPAPANSGFCLFRQHDRRRLALLDGEAKYCRDPAHNSAAGPFRGDQQEFPEDLADHPADGNA